MHRELLLSMSLQAAFYAASQLLQATHSVCKPIEQALGYPRFTAAALCI